MKLGFLGGEVWTGLRRNLSMALSVILVTMVSVFLLGLGMLAQRQADTMKGYWYDRIQVSVFLCNDVSTTPNCDKKPVTDAERDTIEKQLKAMPEVKEVYHETLQQAYDRFKEQFRNSDVVNEVSVGAIPESFRVSLKDPTKYAVVSSQFDGAPGVASVQDQERVLSRFFTIINGITVFAIALATLMALSAALLMATTIRQAAFVRRREISIMRLVGASAWTIRMPFLIEMLLVALTGVGLAIVSLWALIRVIFKLGVYEIAASQAWIGVSDVIVIAPWLVGGVALVALLTSLLTLRRYLKV